LWLKRTKAVKMPKARLKLFRPIASTTPNCPTGSFKKATIYLTFKQECFDMLKHLWPGANPIKPFAAVTYRFS
jgi:hypothetical protein